MRYIIVILTVILLNAHFAYADDYGFYSPTDDIACDDMPVNMNAIYEKNRYTCSSGYYLPANADTCAVCPTGGYCNGGTFSFNPNEFQGLFLANMSTTINNICADNFPSNMYATYEKNRYTCSPGYYLPANAVACTICPANSYCPGGTYTFDETTTQGITPCASGLYAPPGMWESAQCGRILHIGENVLYLRATKKTTPSLNVDINGDGIPDYFGNMSTADVPMHTGTTTHLKVEYNNITYSICDDTVCAEN